jgi:hypothetical protein
MTKNLLNLILLVVAIVLITLINLSQEKNTELDQLTSKATDSISNIVIKRKNNTVTISRQSTDKNNNQWQITQPVSVAANTFRINSLLKIINAPIHSQYAANEIDLSKIGLENATTSIQLDQTTLHFGITNPSTNLRYVQMGHTVYTIEDVYYPLINSHHSTLVSLSLLPPESQIEKLILPNQTIQQDEKNRWKSSSNTPPDEVSKTLDLWQNSQAFGVHEYMQRENLGEITAHLKQQSEPIHFIVTDTAPWLIIARPEIGLEYHLEIESYAELIKPAD